MRASTFTNSVGVNVHVEYTDGQYASSAAVVADLQYLGVDHVRDAALNPANQGQSSYAVLASAGIKFDLFFQGTNIPSTLSLVDSLEAAYPGSISAIEGPNEINNWPITYNGLTGNSAGVAYQDALYSAVQGDSALSNVPIYSLTGNTTAGQATDVNVHAYPFSGAQPYSTLSSDLAATPGLSTAAGAVLTEAGYYTLTDGVGWGGVSEQAQATMTLNLVMDATKLGYSQVYLYQLLDAYNDPTGSNPDDHFGLFDLNNNPKPVAVAIHDLMGILDDTGSTAATFTTGSLNYTISNLPSTGNSLLMEKSNGAYDIVVWNEPQVWNATTETDIAVAPTTVTVNLGGTFTNVSVYDPMTGETAIATAQNTSSIQVAITDSPLIIEVSGLEATQVTSSPTVVKNGQTQTMSGGTTQNMVVNSGGKMTALGGLINTMTDNGSVTVASGANGSGITVGAGGTLTVAGGKVSGTVVNSGGAAYVSSGGVASVTVVNAGGKLTVSGGVLSGVTDKGGSVNVASGGVANGITIGPSGTLAVSGGTVAGMVLNSGGSAYVSSGGAVRGDTVNSGGKLTVSSGGLVNTLADSGLVSVTTSGWGGGITVGSGATLTVSGGSVSGTVVDSGGLMTASGGSIDMLTDDGSATVAGGARGSGVTIGAGGTLTVSGATVSAMIVNSGGTAHVLSGGVISGVTDNSSVTIASGANGSAITVGGGGGLTVSGGTAAGTVINSGGAAYVTMGGAVRGDVVNSGGLLSASGSGSLINTVTDNGAVSISASGWGGSITVGGGGALTVSGGTISGTTVNGGGAVSAASATVSGTVVNAGALLTASGGLISTMTDNGSVTVTAGGRGSGITIGSGGTLTVSGGTVSGTVVKNGGAAYISSGGVASATVVNAGGTLVVSSGGALASTLSLAGGTATIIGAVTSATTVSFVGSGGELILNNVGTFSGKIVGLQDPSQKIDLMGFAYNSGETASWTEAANKTSGTLTVTDGAQVAKLTLQGSYVTGNFVMSSDNQGGTIIVDPPFGSTPAPSQRIGNFVQAMASFGTDSNPSAIAPHALTNGNLLGASFLTAGSTGHHI